MTTKQDANSNVDGHLPVLPRTLVEALDRDPPSVVSSVSTSYTSRWKHPEVLSRGDLHSGSSSTRNLSPSISFSHAAEKHHGSNSPVSTSSYISAVSTTPDVVNSSRHSQVFESNPLGDKFMKEGMQSERKPKVLPVSEEWGSPVNTLGNQGGWQQDPAADSERKAFSAFDRLTEEAMNDLDRDNSNTLEDEDERYRTFQGARKQSYTHTLKNAFRNSRYLLDSDHNQESTGNTSDEGSYDNQLKRSQHQQLLMHASALTQDIKQDHSQAQYPNLPSYIELPKVNTHSTERLHHSAQNKKEKGPRSGALSTADFTIAIVGPRGIGKSTVIREGLKHFVERPNAIFGLNTDSRITKSTSQINIGGQQRCVQALEIDMSFLDFDSQGVVWPEHLPRFEGAMLCYDATDPTALKSLSVLLRAFWTRGSNVPLIVLACKSSNEGSEDATDPVKAAELCNIYGAGIVALDGGVDDHGRKMKDSFTWMIRTIILNRGEVRSISVSSSSTMEPHGRRRSLNSDLDRNPKVATQSVPQPTRLAKNSSELIANDSSKEDPLIKRSALGLSVVQDLPVKDTHSTTDAIQARAKDHPKRVSPSLASDRRGSRSSKNQDLFFNREDIMDKFLFASVTGNDEQYVNFFLVVFRRFARPFEVLSKLIERFDFVAGRTKSDPLLSRFAQMKLCGVLSNWMKTYPGDFCADSTFHALKPFLEGLLPRGASWVAHFAVELVPLLPQIQTMQDPDSAWCIPDVPGSPSTNNDSSAKHRDSESLSSRNSASSPFLAGVVSSKIKSASNADLSSHVATSGSKQARKPLSGMSRDASSSSLGLNDLSSNLPALAENETDKVDGWIFARWQETSNAVLELTSEVIADQITRIAWKAFVQMTPRDLLRHVLTSRQLDTHAASTGYSETAVMRSINFVNYIADWVVSVILCQSRTKARARAFEKFIHVAERLRKMDNFDSLMGVLAGLNSQPIFRLTDTLETVNLKLEGDREKVPKELRSLNRLMASTKGFSAYRAALADSNPNVIPYLGVHLQDLTVLNEIKSDMCDGKVNWTKFSQMGRAASVVMNCSRSVVTIAVDKVVEDRILGLAPLQTNEQYILSYQYQNRASALQNTTSKARFKRLVASVSESLAS